MYNPTVAEAQRLIQALAEEIRKPAIHRPEAVTRWEKQYCDNCMCDHWVQVVRRGGVVCHGSGYMPRNTVTHYTRWRSGGIEVCAKIGTVQPHDPASGAGEADELKADLSWLDLV